MGDSDFVEQVKKKFFDDSGSERKQPVSGELGRAYEPEKLIERFLRLRGKERKEICRRGRNSIERAMFMEFLYRFCRLT